MTVKEIEEKSKSIVCEKLWVEPNEVSMDADLRNDLGADSLDMIEMLIEFEKEFNVRLSDERYYECRSLEQAFTLFFGSTPKESDDREIISNIESRILCFRLNPDGKIEVVMKFEDGSWCYADGSRVLPSNIILLTFSRWTSILKELEDIINDPKTKEGDLQKFFETYPELLAGDDYDVVIPQAVIVKDDDTIGRSDFVLAPKNPYDFSKILELKRPQAHILNQPRAGHVKFSYALKEAIDQVRDYSLAFENPAVRKRFKEMYKIDVFRPDMHLIAGRKWDLMAMDRLRVLQKDNQIKIDSWDTVLDRLRRRFT